jgi:rSAM/selenodomain-associated transferase 1
VKRLGLFARAPEAGRVKTRLSPALPPRLACDLYRGLLGDAIDVLASARSEDRTLFVAGDGHAGIEAGGGVRVEPQVGRDLGERLENAFAGLLRGDGDRAVIFGADCPALSPAVIDRAFAALEREDAVVAPARDGGYALIGLRRLTAELFRGIDWSTDRVMAQTLERARSAGLRVDRLETLDDLDTPEDLIRALLALGSDLRLAPRTRGALERMRLLPPLAL